MQYGELPLYGGADISNGRAVIMSTDSGVSFTDMTGDAKGAAQFRRRLDGALMDELLALQAAAALDAGLGSPAQLVVAPFPSEQGSPRVNDAAPLYQAKKKSSRSARTSPSTARPGARRCRRRHRNSNPTSPR
jgi:hypothetical protein